MYTKVKETEVPKRERKAESRFERTPEWTAMRKDLDRKLKSGEALQIALTEAEMLKYGITNRRTIARFIMKYLAEKDLGYEVKSFHRGGLDYVVVRHKA